MPAAAPCEVTCDLATGHRMADERCAGDAGMGKDRREIVGQRVVVVAGRRLGRMAVAAPVVDDGAMAVGDEIVELRLPDRTGQRPAMDEHDRWAVAFVTIGKKVAVAGFDESGAGHDDLLVTRA